MTSLDTFISKLLLKASGFSTEKVFRNISYVSTGHMFARFIIAAESKLFLNCPPKRGSNKHCNFSVVVDFNVDECKSFLTSQ